MKILMTGATGFIGKNLGKELFRRGHEINIVSRSAKGLSPQLPFPCRIYEWNPEQNKIPLAALENVEVVVNLAGASVAHRWSDKTKEDILSSRLMSSETLWSAISKIQNVHTFVSAGAIGFYGDSGNNEVEESSPVGDGFLADVSRRWEKSVFKGPDTIRKVVIRIGMVLGKEGALKQMIPVFRMGAGGVLGNGRQWMSWIHINDLVQIFVKAIENKEIVGVVNGVAPKPVQNAEFTKTLAKILNRPAIVPVPNFALKIVLGEMSDLVLLSQKVSSKKIQKFDFQFQFEDLKSALDDIVNDH